MPAGSSTSLLLRCQTSLFPFLAPAIPATFFVTISPPRRPCSRSLDTLLWKPSISSHTHIRLASSVTAAVAAPDQQTPEDDTSRSDPAPLLKPLRRPTDNVVQRELTLLQRLKNHSKPARSKEDSDRENERLLDQMPGFEGLGQEGSTVTDVENAQERFKAAQRAEQRRRERGEAQSSRQGNYARSMKMPQGHTTMADRTDLTLHGEEPTRHMATIQSRPSLGRTVDVVPERGLDLGRAIRSLEIECSVNRVRDDRARQRFHERGGLKRKRLKSLRWRRNFKQGFKAVVAKVKAMRRKGCSISPRTGSPIISPVSPKSAVKPRRQGRPAIESRWTESNLPQINVNPAQQDFDLDPASWNRRKLELASQEQTSAKTRESVGSSVSKRSSKRSSNASSIGQRALKLVRRPVIKPSTPVPVKPPIRSLKSSRSWKHETAGHWLEIRIGKTPENVTKSPDTELPEIPHAPFPTPEASSYRPSQPRVTHTLKPPTPLSQQMQRSTGSSSPETRPKKSIVDRTKQILGIKSSLNLSSSGKAQARRRSSADDTTRILNRASNALTELVDKFRLTPPSTSTSTSNLSATSIALKSTHARRTLLRPGYRRSRPTGHSSSSSVRRVMFGNPPIPSPNLEDTYTASDAQQYFRVDLTDPNGPAYLPSEARRINTPPLPGENSKLRGFFFDYNAPEQQQQQQQSEAPPGRLNMPKPTTTATAPLPRRQLHYARPRSPSARPLRRRGDGSEDIEWFRVKVAIDEQADDEAG
ncbi:MAG: hypothetical protein Q9212_006573, partial [Teloschistes hypoglaucus]